MLRYRRYRVFLVFTIFAIAALYRFTTVQEWEAATASSVEKLKEYAGQSYKGKVEEDSIPLHVQETGDAAKTQSTQEPHKIEAALPPVTAKPIGDWKLGLKATPTQKGVQRPTPDAAISTPTPPGKPFGLSGQSRIDAAPPFEDQLAIHWEPIPEHFPIPKDRLIILPKGTPISIPKLQHAFKEETSGDKLDREKKQAQIKAAFEHSWKGYKDKAWLHDELRPVSGTSRDTFCGWGATLVDALDTLWIMGLKNEFEEAVKALEKIDFTTTSRTDIPLFETTIRYLGGLVAAYDVSGGSYKILLTKAQQLGDVLMAAFDTPNRMPITYYNWRPTFAKNPHRAGTRTVLAELGSLSMEFTRLAQVTGEDKYYDAVARITNELELMQSNTRVPGLWPEKIDTSGCQKPPSPSPQDTISRQQEIANQARIGITQNAEQATDSVKSSSENAERRSPPERSAFQLHSKPLHKRQLDTDNAEHKEIPKDLKTGPPAPPKPESEETPAKSSLAEKKTEVDKISPKEKGPAPLPGTVSDEPEHVPPKINHVEPEPAKAKPFIQPPSTPHQGQTLGNVEPNQKENIDCLTQGLTSPPHSYSESFKFGGSADSTYEYLPKMYLLTGGLVPQYKSMYTKAVDAANKYLLFRAMIPDNDREILVVGSAEVREGWPEFPEGNFSMNPQQSHLLCFTGGMYGMGAKIFNRNEDFDIAKKITDGCVWSYESTATGIMPESMSMIACPSRTECSWNETLWQETIDPYWQNREEERIAHQKQMEEFAEAEVAKQPVEGPLAKRDVGETELTSTSTSTSTTTEAATSTLPALYALSTYNLYPTREEYVEQRVRESRLFKGVPHMMGRQYILRPEAIESVFIMYRMTGDDYWRQKGWKMWEAIERETRAEFGHSAISDVSNKDYEGNKNDEMESFWLAETLKYFYLLFSTPETISLDDWVLNTEAHPFKRPT